MKNCIFGLLTLSIVTGIIALPAFEAGNEVSWDRTLPKITNDVLRRNVPSWVLKYLDEAIKLAEESVTTIHQDAYPNEYDAAIKFYKELWLLKDLISGKHVDERKLVELFERFKDMKLNAPIPGWPEYLYELFLCVYWYFDCTIIDPQSETCATCLKSMFPWVLAP